jgi:hypothetical protein
LRPGYLGALASRTLGVAPVLRPATPSRFEPDRPQQGLAEIEQVVEVTPSAERLLDAGPGGAVRDEPEAERTTAPEAHRPARPARPSVATGRPRREEPLVPQAFEPTTPSPAEHTQALPLPTREQRDTRTDGWLDDRSSVIPEEIARTLHRSEEPTWPYAAGGPGERLEASRRAGPTVGPTETAPSKVVVHIGRIEVQAVRAPAPAVVAAPTPRQPAQGTSLADQLRARDRGRR